MKSAIALIGTSAVLRVGGLRRLRRVAMYDSYEEGALTMSGRIKTVRQQTAFYALPPCGRGGGGSCVYLCCAGGNLVVLGVFGAAFAWEGSWGLAVSGCGLSKGGKGACPMRAHLLMGGVLAQFEVCVGLFVCTLGRWEASPSMRVGLKKGD